MMCLKSAVIFENDALGRRIEKCITKAGSEKVISFAEKKVLAEESKWETIGGVRIRRPNVELQKPHVVQEVGEKNFIPFRFQGQYEDEEIGLYYNRFRYYDPKIGQYTQQDPIGLAGGNPTLYGYVYDTLNEMDPFGLTWRDLLASGLGHHLFPRSVAKKLGISQLAKLTALSWYPNVTDGSGKLHQDLHRLLREAGVPFHGSKFTGDLNEFWKMAEKAYAGLDDLGYLKIPGTKKKLYKDVTPKQALAIIKELYDAKDLPTVCGK